MDAPAAPSSPAVWRRHATKLVVSLVIAVAFVLVFRRGGIPLAPPREALGRVSPLAVAGYAATMIGMQWFRAARWRWLLAPIARVPLRRIINVSFVGFAAILLMPLRAGEFVRPYMMRQKGHVSLAAATGTIGAERVIDGLLLTGMLGLCLRVAPMLDPLPSRIGKLEIPVALVPFYAYCALALFLAAFTAMALFYWQPRVAHRITYATLGVVSKKLAEKAATFVATMADGLSFLPSLRYFGLFLLETLAYWTLNAVGMWLLAVGCGIPMSLLQACVVMGVLGVGILVPAGPGLFGAFQASVYAALAMFFPSDVVLGAGAAYVFLLYGVQFGWQALSGLVCLALESRDDPPADELAGGPDVGPAANGA